MRRKKSKTLKSSTLFLKSLRSMIARCVIDIVQFEEIAQIQVSHYTNPHWTSIFTVVKEWHDMGQQQQQQVPYHEHITSSTVRAVHWFIHRNAWTKPHSGKKCCQIMKELQAEATKPRYIHNNIRPSKAKSQTSSTLIYYSYIFWLKK